MQIMQIHSIVVAFFLTCLITVTVAQTNVTRGPYLQKGTPTSMVIQWRTADSVQSVINFGPSPQNLTQTVQESDLVKEHALEITGLDPAKRYYYEVADGNGALAGGDSTYYFQTSPEPGTDTSNVRIWAIGDFGDDSQEQRDVRDAYLSYNDSSHTDIWMMLGDHAYDDGTDLEYQDKVFDVYTYQFRNTVSWPTPGNHDYNSVSLGTTDGPYYDIFTLPTNGEAGGVPSGTEGYYSFDYGNVHFISLNSEEVSWSLNDNNEMIDWLKQDLENTERDWTIVFWHQPPHSKGTHDSDDFWEVIMQGMRTNIAPILENYGVDLIMNGHSHVYERSYLINGFYGTTGDFNPSQHIIDTSSGDYPQSCPYTKEQLGLNPNAGAVYNVIGNSGKDGDGSLDHPAMYFGFGGDDNAGSMVIDVKGNRLDAQYINRQGNVLDHFTVMKDVNNKENVYVCDTTKAVSLSASWIGDYQWDVGDSTMAVTVNPKTDTNYRVNDPQGCLADTFQVLMNRTLPVDIADDTTICSNETLTLDAGYTESIYNWSNGATSRKIDVSQQGDYSVKVENPYGCKGSDTMQLDVIQINAGFSIDNYCSGSPTRFQESSTSSSTIQSYEWQFGDGESSTGPDAVHMYDDTGTYSAKLITTTANCIDTAVQTVTVDPATEASFSANTVCVGDSTEFTNNTSPAKDSLSYIWAFGDGDSSTLAEPTHYYDAGGTYNVTLIAITDSGCLYQKTEQVVVGTGVSASFLIPQNDIPVDQQFSLSNQSTSGASWQWQFGDGTTSTEEEPTHSYTDTGSYNIQLYLPLVSPRLK